VDGIIISRVTIFITFATPWIIAAIAFAIVIKSALMLERADRNHVIDLLIVGSIIYLTVTLTPYFPAMHESMAFASSLIFYTVL